MPNAGYRSSSWRRRSSRRRVHLRNVGSNHSLCYLRPKQSRVQSTRSIRGGLMLGKLLKTLSAVMLFGILAAAQTIPSGTPLTVRINSQISSATAQTGQKFDGVLARDLVVNNQTIAKTGTVVHGKVSYAKSSGRLHAPGQLTVRLTSMDLNGKHVSLATTGYYAKGKSHT